MIRLFSGRLI